MKPQDVGTPPRLEEIVAPVMDVFVQQIMDEIFEALSISPQVPEVEVSQTMQEQIVEAIMTLPRGETFEVIPQKRESEKIEELDILVSQAEVTCISRVQEQHVDDAKETSQYTFERDVALHADQHELQAARQSAAWNADKVVRGVQQT